MSDIAVELKNLNVFYGDFHAVDSVNLSLKNKKVTALIGPSGCGKSTVLRSINRMNELISETKVTGEIIYGGININRSNVDPVEIRKRIGMVFQKPNPFPKSIYDNITWGAKIHGHKDDLDELVERTLKQAALWDEVKDKLKQSALRLSGGQQQRLCIARTIAVKPDVILMDEPASALDPIATGKIEELIAELKHDYTIAIVTHNMQQASRVSDYTSFFLVNDERRGHLVEYGKTDDLFFNPKDKRTEDYISGKFG
ncbi:phosphate ABC transporter ATP-binding protein [Thiospirochaeta perfilievii]|uniref:Phosphate ABC transporter ATP-binding protein n=1 Tax=Thiospirochaeta perfilievii TaxID=252967 RepID=A0A5C1QDN5_9SPIO|nr:phosphate ABC transporter ATP-binding protein PstB [Thiospirochaeta perfilievii]QEN05089.1 phosphate ABC transporter ATP-binding protein [Thiospirochaeta perfilievii]